MQCIGTSYSDFAYFFFPVSPKKEKGRADVATLLPAYIQVLLGHEERVKMSEPEVSTTWHLIIS